MNEQKSFSLLQLVTLVTGVIATLFFYTASLDPFNLPKATLIFGGGLGVLFGLGVLGNRIEKVRLLASLPFLIFVIIFAVCGILGTSSTHRFIIGTFSRATGFMAYFGMVALALGMVISTRGQKFKATYIALASVAGVEVFYGLLQFFKVDPVHWNNPYNRIIGTLGNPNFMSATLGFSGVALFSIIFNSRYGRLSRIVSGITSIIAFAIALASDSVQGPIAFGIGASFIMGVAIWKWKGRSPLLYSYGTVAGTTLVIVLLAFARVGPLADKLYQYTLGVRIQYWRAALKMMSSSPWNGVGVDSYGDHYRLVRDQTTFKTVGPETFTNAAHSVPLQLGATLGIPTLVLYVAIQLLVIQRIAVTLKRSPDNSMSIAGIAAAWLAFQAQSYISIDQLGVGVWGWILSGALIGGSFFVAPTNPAKRVRRKDRKASRVATVSIMVAFGAIAGTAVAWQSYLPDLRLRTAIGTPFYNDNAASVMDRASVLTAAGRTLIDEAGYQNLVISEIARMPGAGQQTIDFAKYVAAQHPESWDAQNVTASIFENLKRYGEALPYRLASVKLDPMNWNLLLSYAQDLEGLGKISLAKVQYQKVAVLYPASKQALTAKDALTRLG